MDSTHPYMKKINSKIVSESLKNTYDRVIPFYYEKIKPLIKKQKSPTKYLNVLKKKLIVKFDIKIDYLEVRNEYNLQKLERKKRYRIFIAYFINKVRLIDNF